MLPAQLVDAVLLLLEAALLLLGVGGGLLLLALEAALGLGELGGGVGVLAGGLAEGLLGGGHGPLERLHVGLVAGGGLLGVGEGLLGAVGLAAGEGLTGGGGDRLLLERLGELAHALGEDRRVGLLAGLELGLGLRQLLLELLEAGEGGGAVELAAGEGVEHLEHGLGDLGGGVLAADQRAEILAQGLGEGAVGGRARGDCGGGDGDADAIEDRLVRWREGRDEHGREDSRGAEPAEREVAGAGARERDDGARVEVGGGGLGVGAEQLDEVGAARVVGGTRAGGQLDGAAEQVVEGVVVIEAAGGVAGLAGAQGGPQQDQRGRDQAEPGEQRVRGGFGAEVAAKDGEGDGGDQEAEREGDAGEQAGGLGEPLAPLHGAYEAVHGMQAGGARMAGHVGSWRMGHVLRVSSRP